MSDYGQYTQNAIRNFLADNLPNSSDGEMTSATSATVDHSASTSSRRGEGMVEGGARHTSGVYLLLALTHYGYLSMVTVDTLCGAISFQFCIVTAKLIAVAWSKQSIRSSRDRRATSSVSIQCLCLLGIGAYAVFVTYSSQNLMCISRVLMHNK